MNGNPSKEQKSKQGKGLFIYKILEKNMFLYFIVLIALIPAIEIYILISLGHEFGLAETFFFVISTGIVGAYIARLQGFYLLRDVNNQINQGIMPTDKMIDGALLLVGGIALLLPGLLTDIIGLFLLIPLIRTLIRKQIEKRLETDLSTGSGTITIDAISSENEEDAG